MLKNLLERLRSLITEVETSLETSPVDTNLLIKTRQVTQQAKRELEDKRRLELAEAKDLATSHVPEVKELISKEAALGRVSTFYDVPTKRSSMTWGGIYLESCPWRDDVGNALIQLFRNQGFNVDGRWISQDCGHGYMMGYFRIWIEW